VPHVPDGHTIRQPAKISRTSGHLCLIPDNGHAERLIGSIREECLDHVVILGEGHLRGYYNEQRTHRSLAKDAPLRRVTERSTLVRMTVRTNFTQSSRPVFCQSGPLNSIMFTLDGCR